MTRSLKTALLKTQSVVLTISAFILVNLVQFVMFWSRRNKVSIREQLQINQVISKKQLNSYNQVIENKLNSIKPVSTDKQPIGQNF